MLLPPTLFRFSFSWRVHHARYPSGPAHDEPTAYIAPSSPCPSACLPAPRSALVHPLCLGVHGIYKHHSASVDSLLPLPLPVSFQSPASLFSTSSLSLTLNKKSLLIARNLWDSAPRRLTSSSFFYLFLHLYLSAFLVPAFIPLSPSFAFFSWNKLRVSASACSYYCSFFANYLYTRVCIVVACLRWLDSKAEILFSLSFSLPLSSLTPAYRFVDSKGTLTTTFDRTTMGGGETYSHPFIPLPRRMLRVYPVSRVTKCTRRHPPSSARACTCRFSVL